MAGEGLSESRAARLGLAAALVLVSAQVAVGTGWSLSRDDPTELQLTTRCLEREKGLTVEPTRGDAVAASASGGTLRTRVEGGLATISIGRSTAEMERLRGAYEATGVGGDRLDVHGRYVVAWLRDPSPTQRQATYDCAY